MADYQVQTLALGTASAADFSGYTEITNLVAGNAPAGERDGGTPWLGVFGSVNGASGSATVRFVLSDGTTVYQIRDLTLTPTTATTAHGGGASDYICKVEDEDSAVVRGIEVFGHGHEFTAGQGGATWRVGAAGYTTVTNGTLWLVPLRY